METTFKQILKLESIKLLNYKTFVILVLVFAAILLLAFLSLQSFVSNITVNQNNSNVPPLELFKVYRFPDIWQNFTYFAGHLKIFPAFIIIIIITNEFTFNTQRQLIISGLSRNKYVLGKISVVFMLSALITIFVALSSLILGLFHNTGDYSQIFSRKLLFIPVFLLELFTYLNLAALFASIFRKTGLALMAFLLYMIMIERIIAFYLPEKIETFLPLKAIANLIPLPNSPLFQLFGVSFAEHTAVQDVITCLVYNAIFITAILFISHKRNL